MLQERASRTNQVPMTHGEIATLLAIGHRFVEDIKRVLFLRPIAEWKCFSGSCDLGGEETMGF